MGAPSVDKQNSLLASGNVRIKLVSEAIADIAAVSPAKLPLHIHDFDLGQTHVVISLRQGKHAVFSCLSVVTAGDIRRG